MKDKFEREKFEVLRGGSDIREQYGVNNGLSDSSDYVPRSGQTH